VRRRDLLAASLSVGGLSLAASAVAQPSPATPSSATPRAGAASVPHRRLKSTLLFKSPQGWPNAIRAVPEGLWIGEQLTLEGQGVSNDAFLVDWTGKVLRQVKNESKNTSGLGVGGGHLWFGANAAPNGIFRTDMNGRTISHRQIPLGPADNGGGCHGITYQDGKVYINALRLHGILRVDAETWQPEFLIPYTFSRTHELAWDNGALWMVTGTTGDEGRPGLAKYDAATGRLLETAEIVPGSADPHGLTMHNGELYGCDAGIHPGWPDRKSPGSGYVFKIDFV